jgi:hypothetical protein
MKECNIHTVISDNIKSYVNDRQKPIVDGNTILDRKYFGLFNQEFSRKLKEQLGVSIEGEVLTTQTSEVKGLRPDVYGFSKTYTTTRWVYNNSVVDALEKRRKEVVKLESIKQEKLDKVVKLAQNINAVGAVALKDPSTVEEGLLELSQQLTASPSEATTALSMVGQEIADIALDLFPPAQELVESSEVRGTEQKIGPIMDETGQMKFFQIRNLFNSIDELNTKLRSINKSVLGIGSEKNLNEVLKKAGVDTKLRQEFLELVNNNPQLRTLKVSEILNFYIKQFEKNSNEQYYKAILEPINKELENLLIKYFERFHIKNEEIESLKDRFGVDSTGVFDVLNKAVYYAKNRNLLTVPEEYGHVFVELLGAIPGKKSENPLITYLFDNIESWDGYKRVVDDYKNLYVTPLGNPDYFRIKKEAIGQVIGLALVRNYEGMDKSKTFWAKVKELIDYVFSLLDTVPYVSLNTAADSIARDILNNNYKKLDRIQRSTANYNLLSYSETIKQQNKKDGGKALKFMKWFSDHGMIITGSLSYRYQGETYRPNIDALHDIDNVVPQNIHGISLDIEDFVELTKDISEIRGNLGYVRINAEKLAQKIPVLRELKQQYPDTEFLYAYNNNKAGVNYVTINAIWSEDQSLKDRFKSYTGSFNKRLSNYTEEELAKMYLFDFFLSPRDSSEYTVIAEKEYGLTLNHFSESFYEKQSTMGRPKDSYDYQKWKPFSDTIEAPVDLKSRLMYYQLPTKKESVIIKPGVQELFDSNPELANQVYSALGFTGTKSVSQLDKLKTYLKKEDYRLKTPAPSWITDPTTSVGKMLEEINISIVKDTLDFLRNQNKKIEQLKTNANLLTNDLYKQAGINPVKLLEDESIQLENIQRARNGEKRLPTPELDKLNALKTSNRDLYEEIEELGDKQTKLIKESSNAFEKEVKKFFNSLMEYEQKELGTTLTPQQKQQALQLYSQYLDSIFPDSKVKDIVYHGTNAKFDKFDKTKLGTKTINKTNQLGFYFSDKKVAAMFNSLLPKDYYNATDEKLEKLYTQYSEKYGEIKAKEILDELVTRSYDKSKMFERIYLPDSNFISAIINSKNPLTADTNEFAGGTRGDGQEITNAYKNKAKNNDSIILPALEDGGLGGEEFESDNYVVFEPEQVHILGNKQDIEGFKKFVDSSTSSPAFNKKGGEEKKESRSQKEIYNIINPEGKISKSEAGYVVLGETGYKRVTEVVRSKFQLGNKETSEPQILGDLFHAHAANLIAAAFPEYNTHYRNIKLDGIPQATLNNINTIIKPIIEDAKKKGSVLVVELPVANTKKKIAGTIDLLEITKDGKLLMKDYKTSMSKGTTVGRYKKLMGNSKQQALYKEILEFDDEALGRTGLEVGYQSLMNVISYINKSGVPSYKVQETIPVIYQSTLNKRRDEMLSILYDQIENLASKINKDNREKINALIEAKRALMVRIQTNAKDADIIQTAAGDIAAIEAYLSDNNDVDNYVEFRGDLELYSNLSAYVEVKLAKDKDTVDFIQGKARRLYTELYNKVENNLASNIAEDLKMDGSPIQKAEDVMKPVTDINLYKAMAFGSSYSNNPIVVGIYKMVTEKLAIARRKTTDLANEIKKVVSDLENFVGTKGESIYESLLQVNKNGDKTGYVVDQFLPEYWTLRRKAKSESDVNWFKDNAEFDKEAFTKGLENQKLYLDSTKKAKIAAKIQYLKSKPEYKSNAEEKAKGFVETEIKQELEKWVKANNTIIAYNKPKSKWTDPKWKEIKEGRYKGTPVEKFYDLYISTMNALEDSALLPFDFRGNFIADFRKSFLDRIINNGVGNMKLGRSIVDSLSIQYDEAEVNKINPFTGEFIRRIPIAGKKVLSSAERQEFNKNEKSYDLGNSLAVFFESAVRYKELSEIEKHVEVARDMLIQQKEKILNVKGEEAKGGFNLIKVSKGLDNTIQQFNYFVDSALYGKSTGNESGFEVEGNGITKALGLLDKGEKATISYSRLFDSLLRYTGLNNLGYNLYSPVTNILGGKSMQLLQGIGGRWYGVGDYNFATLVVSAGPFSKATEDVEKANLFVEMLAPEMNDFVKDKLDELKSENKFIKNVPGPMSAMRWSENHLHKAGLIAMIKSNKHSVKWDEWEVKDGKLVSKEKIEEATLESFRQKVLHVNGRAIGNMNPDDKIMLKKWMFGRAIIQHRGWIPAMLQAHWSSRQYDYALGEYVEGRFNSLFRFVTSKKLSWKSLDEVEKANVKEALAEMSIILAAYMLYAVLKSGADDDESKKRLAYVLKISDRYLAEMTFFTPFEISSKYKILISPAPTLGTIESWGRLFKDLGTYIITSDEKEEEKLEKKLGKRVLRVIPSVAQPVRFIDEIFYEQLDSEKKK